MANAIWLAFGRATRLGFDSVQCSDRNATADYADTADQAEKFVD
jgi:hypothetical protein